MVPKSGADPVAAGPFDSHRAAERSIAYGHDRPGSDRPGLTANVRRATGPTRRVGPDLPGAGTSSTPIRS